MRLYAQRRFIAGTALLAFLFAIAFPALAVARQGVDPLAYAKICRVDISGTGDTSTGDTSTGDTSTGDTSTLPGSLQNKLKNAHCVMCVGTGSPPPAVSIAPVVINTAPELLLPVDRRPLVVRDRVVLQPLNPRAPPRA